MKTGTLQELNVKTGDVVKHIRFKDGGVGCYHYNFVIDENGDARSNSLGSWFKSDSKSTFELISRAGASEEAAPRTWGEMTDVEKGALLLAWQQGCNFQYWDFNDCEWDDADIDPRDFGDDAYRIRPEPKRETVRGRLHILDGSWPQSIPVSLVVEDGTPDCASIEMEEL